MHWIKTFWFKSIFLVQIFLIKSNPENVILSLIRKLRNNIENVLFVNNVILLILLIFLSFKKKLANSLPTTIKFKFRSLVFIVEHIIIITFYLLHYLNIFFNYC